METRMRLLYTGSHECAFPSFKRLLMVADEIVFMDRPSVKVGKWGTVGTASPLRHWVDAFAGQPVKLSVERPPLEGPADDLFLHYIHADLDDPEFRRVFLTGLANDDLFRNKFIQPEANYVAGSGAEILRALLQDDELRNTPLRDPDLEGEPFQIADAAGRRDTLRMMLTEASIHITNAMLMADVTDSTPVTDDRYLAELLAMRTSGKAYVGGTLPVAPMLGLEIARAVIPDEALAKLSFRDILDYRKKAASAYEHWTVEINKLAAEMDSLKTDKTGEQIGRLIAAKVAPRLIEYRNEMKAIRDGLFGDLLKTVTWWKVPVLSLAWLARLSYTEAIAAFVAFALIPAVPAVVDYVGQKREVSRKHAAAYLIGLAREAK
ncbi:MAG TPA: hypothetical protein VMX94_08480 [Armatimonadota bacterium]|nr:hypothetical protein [Armatimonadota bacterium]